MKDISSLEDHRFFSNNYLVFYSKENILEKNDYLISIIELLIMLKLIFLDPTIVAITVSTTTSFSKTSSTINNSGNSTRNYSATENNT